MVVTSTYVVGQPEGLRPPKGRSQWWGKSRIMVKICDRDRVRDGAGLSGLLWVTFLSHLDLGVPLCSGLGLSEDAVRV